jgi:hypothetical protein
MFPYPSNIEDMMKKYYLTLSEKDKRRYAALEAHKLGQGGIQYIAGLLGCHRNTITTGLKELAALPEEPHYDPRIRKAGGGRKSYAESHPEIDEAFQALMADQVAGDPMDGDIKWTNQSPQALADQLDTRYGIKVSHHIIRKLLVKHNYRRRQVEKKDNQAE